MEELKILLIEDDEDYAFLEEEILQDELNARITTVTSGDELENDHLDTASIILLDYNLPGDNGVQLLKKIRQVTDVPVVIITGDDKLQIAVDTLKGGADEFLVKSPETLILLPKVVLNTVQKYRQEKMLIAEQKEHEQLKIRIETLQQVLTTLSHYINNSTTTIFGYAQLCRQNPEDVKRCDKLAQISIKETKKITMVLKELENLISQMEIKTTNYANIPDAMFAIEENLKKKLADDSDLLQ